jgi:hypothetical protein
MVINMNESLLRTIAQLQEFLDATPQVCVFQPIVDGVSG